jgi:hypothetical protein
LTGTSAVAQTGTGFSAMVVDELADCAGAMAVL